MFGWTCLLKNVRCRARAFIESAKAAKAPARESILRHRDCCRGSGRECRTGRTLLLIDGIEEIKRVGEHVAGAAREVEHPFLQG